MRIIASRERLIKLLDLHAKTVTAKSTVQVLATTCISLTEDDNALLESTDTEMSLCTAMELYSVQRESVIPPKVCVNPAILKACLQTMTSDDVMISWDVRWYVTVKGGNAEFTLYGNSPEHFPRLPERPTDTVRGYTVASDDWTRWVKAITPYCSTDPLRFYLQGVYFCAVDGKLILVSTDSRRLGVETTGMEYNEEATIVPQRFLHLASDLAKMGSAIVFVTSDSRIYVTAGDHVLSTALIDGRFPQWQAVVPKESTTQVIFARQALLDGVHRVEKLLSSDAPQMILDFTGGTCRLSSHASPTGVARIDVDVESKTGPDIRLGCNHKYLRDALAYLSSDHVTVSLTKPAEAIMITPVQDEVGPIRIVMPMRLEEPTNSAATETEESE